MTKSLLPSSRLCVLSLTAALALLCLPGCNKASLGDVTGSIGRPTALPTDEAALRRYTEELGQRYDRNPKDKTVAMTYAKALHALDQNSQAVAVM